MAHVALAHAAVDDLDRLVLTHSLPDDTRQRVRTTLEPLRQFPRLRPELAGRWEGFRFVLGPWRWGLLVYSFDEARDRVVIVTIQDARASRPATGG